MHGAGWRRLLLTGCVLPHSSYVRRDSSARSPPLLSFQRSGMGCDQAPQSRVALKQLREKSRVFVLWASEAPEGGAEHGGTESGIWGRREEAALEFPSGLV